MSDKGKARALRFRERGEERVPLETRHLDEVRAERLLLVNLGDRGGG